MTATSPLVLGPLLRFVGEHDASVWVETAAPARVTVAADGRAWHAASFVVEGHHYALVLLDDLEPGRTYDYVVSIDDEQVWPPAGSDLPSSSIATLDRTRATLLAFGSCRTSVPHDAEHHASHGVDALRTFALSLAKGESPRPDVLALLGDQVYADETSPQMHDFIASRRDIEEPPGEEIKDYA